MTDLLELAARVEGLTGPDDDVFREAFDACYPKPERVWEDEDRERWSTEYENHHNLSWRFESFLEVGAYLDAAMTLVPEGWGYGLDYAPSGSGLRLILGSPDRKPVFIRAEAMTLPRAITAACLRARAHGGGEG